MSPVQDYAKQLDIQLCYLPSYSPQLNLIERFWKFIRNECLYSKYYANFTDFKAAISNLLSFLGLLHNYIYNDSYHWQSEIFGTTLGYCTYCYWCGIRSAYFR